jgi:hypothetical protein
MRVALFSAHWPPCLAALAAAHLSSSRTVLGHQFWDSWPPLSFALPDQPPPPDHLENHLIWVDSLKVIPLACCRMSLERLVGTRFPDYSRDSIIAIMEPDWFCTGVLKVRHSCLRRAFMNYLACWRSKKALPSTSDVTPLLPGQIVL